MPNDRFAVQKDLASSLMSALSVLGIKLSRGRALEVVAAAHGASEWNKFVAAPTPQLPAAQLRVAVAAKLAGYGIEVRGPWGYVYDLDGKLVSFAPSEGTGKTTILRDLVKVQSEALAGVVVDTSNEVAGVGATVVHKITVLLAAEDITAQTGVRLHLEYLIDFDDWVRGGLTESAFDVGEHDDGTDLWRAVEGLAEDIESFMSDLAVWGLQAWVAAQEGPVQPEALLKFIFSQKRDDEDMILACYSAMRRTAQGLEQTSFNKDRWESLVWVVGRTEQEAEEAAYAVVARGYGLR